MNNSFCYITKQEELYLNDVKIDTTTSVCGYFFAHDYFVYSNKADYTNFIIDINKNTTDSLGKISLQFQKTKNVFVALEKVGGRRNLIMFDLLTKESKVVKSDIGFGIKLLNIDSLIINEGWTLLKSLSLLTGEYEWEVGLGGRKFIFSGEEHEAKISQTIGVIKGHLYVWMNDERLVEIDATTGKIKTETFPLQGLQQQGIIQAVLFPQYYEKEQSLFFFYQDYLVQVHLPTQKITLIWQDSSYNFGPSFITDNYIYFIGNYQKGTVFREYIGVFDRQKNDVVWMQQVIELSKETYNNLKEIQVTDDKIYVLDTGGTLYIYEKQETA